MKPDAKSINIWHTINYLAQSWNSISPKIIENCFIKCGFKNVEISEEIIEETDGSNSEWDLLKSAMNFEVDFNEFVNLDNYMLTSTNEYTIECSDSDTEIEDEINHNEDQEDEEIIIPKFHEIKDMLFNIRTYIYRNEHINDGIIKNLDQLYVDLKYLYSKNLKQAKITDFFNKT